MVAGNDLGSKQQGLTQRRDLGMLTRMMEGDGQSNQSSQQQKLNRQKVLVELLYEFQYPGPNLTGSVACTQAESSMPLDGQLESMGMCGANTSALE